MQLRDPYAYQTQTTRRRIRRHQLWLAACCLAGAALLIALVVRL